MKKSMAMKSECALLASEISSGDLDALNTSLHNLDVRPPSSFRNGAVVTLTDCTDGDGSSVQVTCFTEVADDVTLYFQIIHLSKQIYAWIGCNSASFGHLYAAAPTRPGNTASVTCVLGGTSDNTSTGIARRLVLKTGLNIILASNIPKNSPLLEATAERKLVEKLIQLGYTPPKSKGSTMQ